MLLMSLLFLGFPKVQVDSDPVMQKVEAIFKQMTVAEKVDFCHGTGFATRPIPRLGVPAWEMSDGPQGLRGNDGEKATYFPTGISLASTWNVDCAKKQGIAMGEEAQYYRKGVILGPAINMIRTPLGGRSFEYMSEDPFLAGKLAVNYIQGVQSQGVSACVKHYAANSQENERGTIDARVDERTLRELYLPAFEMAIKEGGARSIMAAYNRLNGTYCAENSHLLNDILKKEWGFKGAAMSDWGAVHSTIGTAFGGLDLEMPGGSPRDFMAQPLLNAVTAGQVPMSVIDDKVRRTLWAIYSGGPGTAVANNPEHWAITRAIARESIVMLKNANSTLPLDPAKLKKIAVIGPFADLKQGGSGGSSSVYSPYEVTALQGIKTALEGKAEVVYAKGAETGEQVFDAIPTSAFPDGLKGEYFATKTFEGEPTVTRTDANLDFDWGHGSPDPKIPNDNFNARWTGTLVAPKTGKFILGTSSDDGSRLYVDGKLVVDNWGDHGVQGKSVQLDLVQGKKYQVKVQFYEAAGDAVVKLYWSMPNADSDPLLTAADEAAKSADAVILCVGTTHQYDTEGSDKPDMHLMGKQDAFVQHMLRVNPKTIVVLFTGSAVETPWSGEAPALLEAWYPGMEGGNALADILFGTVSPSGKLPLTFPNKLADSPAHANGNYPGKNGTLHYDEGLLIGYRYFDTKKLAPKFPFGFGLSYTTFEYSNLKVKTEGHTATVTVDVKNTGKVAGMESVQLYIHPHKSAVERPEKELKGFGKEMLDAGQTKTYTFKLDSRAFAYYDVKAKDWKVEPGNFDVLVGSSSRDIRSRGVIKL